VLLCANSTEQEMELCRNLGIDARYVLVQDENTINHQRLIHIKNYLTTTGSDDIFLVSDVFDVIFQKDPFDQWDLRYDIFLGEEGVDVHEEPWNYSNISGLFPLEKEICYQHPIVCSGIIGGKRDALISLYDQMYDLCEHQSTNAHNIKDQAALILMLAKNQVPNACIFKVNDGWAIHCAVAGPTQFFDAWGFRNKLIAKQTSIPYAEDGKIKTEGKDFAMVHQFNRVPEWNKILTEVYI
jgi:hypothetical protein